MNARIAKEVRSMLPTFGVTLLAIVMLSLMIDGREASDIVMVAFAAFSAAMGAMAFGNEFQARTMPLLLSQPVPRQRMWFEKMLVLGVALAVSAVFMLVSIAFLIRGEGRPENFKETIGAAVLIVFCAFCSGPGITLRVKNTLPAMAITLCLPMAWLLVLIFLAWIGGKLTGSPDLLFDQAFHDNPSFPYWAAAAVTLIYCAFNYWLGRHGFMRFESSDGQSQEIDLPKGLKGLAPFTTRFLPAYSGPVASLIRKELLLQRVSFLVAGFMTALVMIGWVLYYLHPSDLTTTLIIVFPVLACALAPLLTGSVAIAEERNWGTLGWQLTLPASPRKQWLVKFAVAGATCFALGIVLPLVLGGIGSLLRGTSFEPIEPNTLTSTAIWMSVYTLMFGLMLYGSSISSNVVRGILFGLGLLMGVGSVAALIKEAADRFMPRWAGTEGGHNEVMRIYQWLFDLPLMHKIGGEDVYFFLLLILVLFAVFIFCLLYRFARANFLNGEVSPKRIWRQVAILLVVTNILMTPVFMGVNLVSEINDVHTERIEATPPFIRMKRAKPLPNAPKPAPAQPDTH